jgi:hypothetical protein
LTFGAEGEIELSVAIEIAELYAVLDDESASGTSVCPGVQERISELQSLVREATNRGVVQEAVRAHREITIDRNDIIMGLVDEARTAKSDRARVSAWTVLADIFMLRAKNLREVYDFYGWTSDELKLYAETGESPARFQHFAGKGRSATESGTAGLRTNKAS